MEAQGGATKSVEARKQVETLLQNKHGMDQAQASTLVDQWTQEFQKLRSRAEQMTQEAGQAATRGISQGALWGFIALLLGLLVAAWGGWTGTASLPGYTETAAPVVPTRPVA